MGRYRVDIKIDTFPKSKNYGKAFWFSIHDKVKNKSVANSIIDDLDMYCRAYKIKRGENDKTIVQASK
jgi:hypothetical protein